MKYLALPCMLLVQFAWSQNVGIGTTTPTGPLSFSSTAGNKIVLWGDGSTSHYGIGIQSGQLQLYANQPGDNVAIGYGRSTAFTERMRIINAGTDGMMLNGRLHLRNGTNPLDLNNGSGVWLYRADNSSLLGFMGTQNNQNIGFYGGPAGWGFTYDAINSRVGIGNNNPNAPLAFAPSLGKKITLYPGNTGDVGFGVSGNRLQIYSDNPNADVAIGYDAAGTFVERFAFKPNGALALNGQLGTAGQVLRSNGNAAASWTSLSNNDLYQRTVSVNGTNSVLINAYVITDVPGFNYVFNVPGNARVLVSFNVPTGSPECAFCGISNIDIGIMLDGVDISRHRYEILNGQSVSQSGTFLLQVGAGNHTIKLRAAVSGPPTYVGAGPSIFNNNMIVQIIPE